MGYHHELEEDPQGYTYALGKNNPSPFMPKISAPVDLASARQAAPSQEPSEDAVHD